MAKKKLYKSKLFILGLTALICTRPLETMALSTKTLLLKADTTQENIKVDKAQIPELLITEILPDSKNIDGADAYEFIEVYNNSNREVNLKDYKINLFGIEVWYNYIKLLS